MKPIAKYLSILALLLTIGPPAWFMMGRLGAAEAATEVTEGQDEQTGDATDSQPTMKALMLGGAILWFAAAPQWLREDA